MLDYFKVSLWTPTRKAVCFGLMGMVGFGYLAQFFEAPSDDPLTFSNVIGGWLVVYGCAVFGWRGDVGESGAPMPADDIDRKIHRLQRQLSDAAYSQSQAEARGDVAKASYFRGLVFELESQLRRLGA